VGIKEKLSAFFERYIYISGLNYTPREYADIFIKRMIAAMAAILVLLISSLLLKFSPFLLTNLPPNLSKDLPNILMIMAFIVLGGIFFASLEPVFKALEIVGQTEREMPYVASLLTIYASAGIPPHLALSRIGEKADLFPGTHLLVRRIQKLRSLFVLDELDAIEAEARKIPSTVVSDILFSAAGAERGGGSIYIVFKDKMKSFFAELKERYKKLGEQMKLIGDIILIFFGVLPMTMYTMFTLFASPGIVSIAFLFSFIIVPFIGAVLSMIVDTMYPKTPMKYTKYYRRLVYSIPLGIVAFAIVYTVLSTPQLMPTIKETALAAFFEKAQKYKTAISLDVAFIAVLFKEAISFMRDNRRLTSIEMALPSFVRDLTEEIRKGYTPSQALDRLLELRSYGKHLDNLLREVSSAVKIGHTLSEAVQFIKNKVSWRTAVIFEIIGDADRLGAKADVFEEITDVTREIIDAIKIAKSGTVGIRLFGLVTAGLVMGVMALLVNMVLSRIAELSDIVIEAQMRVGQGLMMGFSLITKDLLAPLVDSISIGVVISALILGLLTGKMSDGVLASGFLYAILTLLITLIILLVMM